MPRIPDHRDGEQVKVLQKPVAFSFWPMGRTIRRYGLRPHVFATNPWPIMRRSIQDRCPHSARGAARAFLEQSEDYYRAATAAGVSAAKPVLLYYCFLNLVKAYVLTTARRSSLDQNAKHGLSEQLATGGREFEDAYLDAYRSTRRTINLFHEFLMALHGQGLTQDMTFDVVQLVPQIVTGHRLWTTGSGMRERFIALKDIRLVHDAADMRMWLRFYVLSEDLTRLSVTHNTFLEESRLQTDFREVKPDDEAEWELIWSDDERLLCFEQTKAIRYTDRPADRILDLVQQVRTRVWAVVSIVPPYRRYYVYLSPPSERQAVLPQVASMYAAMFYLASITRYRPHHFDGIIESKYGPMIEALLDDTPTQFLFLMASNFARQEVTKAAIV